MLDRTKEPGAVGEPLYQDVVTALARGRPGCSPIAEVVGGRYGLSSKEFTPAHGQGGLRRTWPKPQPKNHFTVGIIDDVTHLSLPVDPEFDIEPDDVVRAVFFGLGADGTVGANKNSIKIIGEETDNYAQGLLRLRLEEVRRRSRSRTCASARGRSGRPTWSSARTSSPATSSSSSTSTTCSSYAGPGAAFLLNSPFRPDEVWDQLPREVQEQIIEKKLKFYVIDAYEVAKATGMGARINTIMQTCFFAISGVLPRDEAIAQIKKAIKKTYGKRGEEVVQKNFAAVDQTLANLHEVDGAGRRRPRTHALPPIVPAKAPDFVQAGDGDDARQPGRPAAGQRLPGRRHLADRHGAVGEAEHRPRDPGLGPDDLHPVQQVRAGLPARRDPREGLRPGRPGRRAGDLQVDRLQGQRVHGHEVHASRSPPRTAPAARSASTVCPAKDKANPKHKAINMAPQRPLREAERANYDFFLDLPEVDRTQGQGRRQGLAVLPAAVRVLGRLRRLRRDAVRQAAHAALRRPAADRQRHRLLVDLRRQPADHALRAEHATAAARPGRTRCSRTTPSSASASAWPSTSTRSTRTSCCAGWPAQFGDAAGRRAPRGRPVRPRPASPPSAPASPTCDERSRRSASAEAALARAARRLPGPQERLDRRRRRLGLRHRLRRPRPRPRAGPQRQHPRARHRGLLEHRRPGVEGDADRRVGQVRGGRQARPQEGPRPDRHGLRQRLRRPRRLRRQGRADGEGVPRGRGLRRPVAHHRLQPLHRARLRPGARPRAAEAGGGHRLLAALPLRPAAPGQRARTRSCSIRRRPRRTSASSWRTKRASGWSSSRIRPASRCCWRPRSAKRPCATASTSSSPSWPFPSTKPAGTAE